MAQDNRSLFLKYICFVLKLRQGQKTFLKSRVSCLKIEKDSISEFSFETKATDSGDVFSLNLFNALFSVSWISRILHRSVLVVISMVSRDVVL